MLAMLVWFAAALPAEAQNVELFVQARPAMVQDGIESSILRYTGLEVLSSGRFNMSAFHIWSRPYWVLEFTPAVSFELVDGLVAAPGVTGIYDKFDARMVGPNLFVNIADGLVLIPVARYLRSIEDDSHQWAFVAEVSYKQLRATAQTFAKVWELQLGAALPNVSGVGPEARAVWNVDGLGLEFRLNWAK